MRLILAMMLMLPVLGCGIAANDSAICAGLRDDLTAHAAALAVDGGDRSVVTGQRLIARIDAGCGV
jgi:hypothetical protein